MHDVFSKEDFSLYSNAMTFMRAPYLRDPRQSEADVAILGVPFDMATSGRPGSRLGPDAIRRASVNLSWEGRRFPWSFKLSDRLSLVDAGDLVFDCGDAKDLSARLQFAAEQIIASGKALLAFGGDHFVSLPLLRAHHAHYGKMALVHFDAHTDTYSYGSEYDHGTMFYRAPKEGLIDLEHSVQIGIRTEYEADNHGFEVINGMEANDWSVDEIVRRIKQRVGDLPVYLTFDIDCLDPAYAPGTGTPVCGGLSTDKILKVIRALQGINLVGMDVVEVAPGYDQSEVTALAAATIALDLLHLYSTKA
ncbi:MULTISPECIES: agmatinase [unclassified Vibrio]|uniref:Agmatinase n=1 Tax=Vibrio sp. HB236076 TaxID=3232307 RepID=A0AB39HL18_9VIBR|nr:agmatinase [Vibrio sp. HB161653]MDP5253089.1 agmatinase [Vibrio sp. HB161653]